MMTGTAVKDVVVWNLKLIFAELVKIMGDVSGGRRLRKLCRYNSRSIDGEFVQSTNHCFGCTLCEYDG